MAEKKTWKIIDCDLKIVCIYIDLRHFLFLFHSHPSLSFLSFIFIYLQRFEIKCRVFFQHTSMFILFYAGSVVGGVGNEKQNHISVCLFDTERDFIFFLQ